MNKKAFTLIEVLVASAVMLVLLVLAGGALWTGGRSSTRGIEKLDEISKIARLGEYLKKCLRFAVQVQHVQTSPELEEYQIRFVEEISPIDGTRVEKDATFKFAGPPRGAKHVDILFAGRPQPMDFDQLDLRMSITGNLISVQLDGGKNRVLEVAVTSPYMVALSGFTGNPLEGLGASAGTPELPAASGLPGGLPGGLPPGTPLAGLPAGTAPGQVFTPPIASPGPSPGVETLGTGGASGGLGALGTQLGTSAATGRDKLSDGPPREETATPEAVPVADGGAERTRSLPRVSPRADSLSETAPVTVAAEPPGGSHHADGFGGSEAESDAEEEPTVIATDPHGNTVAHTPPVPSARRLDRPVKPVKPVKPLRPTMTAPPSIVPPAASPQGMARSRMLAPADASETREPTVRRAPPALSPALQAVIDRLREREMEGNPPKDPKPDDQPEKPGRETEPMEAAPNGDNGMNQPFN